MSPSMPEPAPEVGPHYLVVGAFVEDDRTDRWDLEHPDSCPKDFYGPEDGVPMPGYYEHRCHEGMLIDDGGFDCYFRHADDDDPLDAHVPVLPEGRYPVRAWAIRHPGGPWGAEEWSAGLDVIDNA